MFGKYFSFHNREKRRFTGTVAVGMAAVLVFVCLFSGGAALAAKTTTSSKEVTSATIKEKEKEIAAAEAEKKEINSKISSLEELKAGLKAAKADLQRYVKELDEAVAGLQADIEDLTLKIEEKEQEITETEAELQEAIQRENDQYAAMIVRMRLMYERKEAYWLEQLLQAKSFREMLNRADYIESVVSYDRQMWEDYQASREYVEVCKAQLEVEQQLLDDSRTLVKEQKASMEQLVEEKNAEIEQYNRDIATKEAAIAEYEADIKAQDEEIKMLEKAIAEEKKRLLEASKVVRTYDGGTFTFPLKSYTRISDDYGMRMHPTLNIEKFHSGVDFAAPYGTAIYAAYSGTVVASGYSSSMGNYIMLDHGDGLYTIYMHASKLCVSKDADVKAGDKIAEVGSTGRSTGNHLHFGVRKDGEYVSPWNYINK